MDNAFDEHQVGGVVLHVQDGALRGRARRLRALGLGPAGRLALVAGRGSFGHGQVHREHAALAGHAVDADRPSHRAHQRPRQRQAEAGSLDPCPLRAQAFERHEEQALLIRRDPQTGVGDADRHPALGSLGPRNADLAKSSIWM